MARYIPDDVLDQIRLRADIVDVVQSYVPTLKKAGMTWKACCPFHHEKTPSFTVNPDRQYFKCFGCGKGGDVFKFVMELENLDFSSAAEHLAHKYGIIIPETPSPRRGFGGSRRESFDGQIEYGTRERLCTLHEKLAKFYREYLLGHPDGPVAAYFRTRGIPNDIAQQFLIGASPDSWDAAIQFARKEGFIDDELRASGIVSSKDDNQARIYDRFRNRLMFPIWNESGRIVGFSARSVEPDPQGWKYVNTPDSPIFHKGRLLYALNFARTSIPKAGAVVLCEGQLDAIAMHRAGVTHAVAPQGTAFTPEQATILKRYTSTAVLATDNDNAGREAVFKDAAILLPLGFNVKVVRYPGAKDADETLSKYGADALAGAVNDAADFFEFALEHALSNVDPSTPAGRATAANDVIYWMIQLENEVTREFYFDWLAKKLGVPLSSVEKVAERRLVDGARHSASAVRRQANAAPPPKLKNTALENAVYELLVLMLDSEEYARKAAEDIPENALGDSVFGKAAEDLITSTTNGEWKDAPSSILTSLEMEGADVSKLVEALDLAAGHAAERAAIEAAREAGQPVPSASCPAADPELSKKFFRNTYNSSVRLILTDYYTRTRAALLEQVKALPPDAPERKALFDEIKDISSALLKLPARFKVVI
ncbi:MAG: DNA primase [Lentisphaeria bacterium]|nr:DNA primase [Lentisphaeria bacterium]